jgi:predicted ATPase
MDLTEREVLHDMIPALEKIVPTSKASNTFSGSPVIKGPDAESRFVRIFGIFVQALTSSGNPIILFLDDLQWAKQSDINLLDSLARIGRSCQKSRLLLLCTCRNSETQGDHPWSSMVRNVASQGVRITEIEVSKASTAEVDMILSRALHLPLDDVRPLSNLVFEHTCGNILFVNLVVDEFNEGGVLRNLLPSSLDAIHTVLKNRCKSVDDLIQRKVQRLPRNEQELLKAASCLGARFSEELLVLIEPIAREDVAQVLSALQDEGLIMLNGKSRTGHFVHDRFQQAAYLLIPENECALTHLCYGRKLWQSLRGQSRLENLLLIGHQISRGVHLLTSAEEKTSAAEMLSWAGHKAASSSAFVTASSFLNLSISLLSDCAWSRNYDLCLRLYSFAAEIEYYNGNLKRVDELVAEILKKAKTLEDKLKAHFTRIFSLGSRNEMGFALDESMEVFKGLGERFPRNPRMIHIVAGMIHCNRMLRGKSNEYILSLPPMRDWKKLAAMRLMTVVGLFAFYSRTNLLPLLAFRLVNLTLRYGISDIGK